MEYMIIGGLIALVIMAVAIKLRKEKEWVVDASVPLKLGMQVKKFGNTTEYLTFDRVYRVVEFLPDNFVKVQDVTIPHNFFEVPRGAVAALVLK